MSTNSPPPDVAAATTAVPAQPATAAQASATTEAVQIDPIQPDLEADHDNYDNSDADSAIDSLQSSTASLSESILEYRALQGRTYHSTRHATEYFTPNDDRQQDSVDLTHHYFTILLDNKLFIAPIGDKVSNVLDVGTGTGIWAIDFADAYPGSAVTGTDLSAIQPSWVPPNLSFNIEDATLPWTFNESSFDFIHMRYLFGGIKDWDFLFEQAYRCCKPGGWLQSCELDAAMFSDDHTTDNNYGIDTWNKLYDLAGKKLGNSFTVIADDLQRKGFENAGFEDITVVNYKLPMGGWALDRKLKEVGQVALTALLNDIQGYTLMLWHDVLQWPQEEYEVFLMSLRKAMRDKSIHAYMNIRFVYGRKPGA